MGLRVGGYGGWLGLRLGLGLRLRPGLRLGLGSGLGLWLGLGHRKLPKKENIYI